MRRGLGPRGLTRADAGDQRQRVSVKAGEGWGRPVSAPGGLALTSLWGSVVLLVMVPLVYSILTSTRA